MDIQQEALPKIYLQAFTIIHVTSNQHKKLNKKGKVYIKLVMFLGIINFITFILHVDMSIFKYKTKK